MSEIIVDPPDEETMRENVKIIQRWRVERTVHGRVQYQVMQMKTSTSSLADALKIYDLGNSGPSPPKEWLDCLVEIFGLLGHRLGINGDMKVLLAEKIERSLTETA